MKHLLIPIIIFFSLPLRAEWKFIYNSAYNTKVYIDNETIQKAPNGYTAVFMLDSNKVITEGNISYRSTKPKIEFDCAKKQMRYLFA